MRILMLVATTLATDTRVKREAAALVDAGHTVHIIGRSVPDDFTAGPGITTSTVRTSSAFRAEGGASLQQRGRLPWPVQFARWVLLPQHSKSSFSRWAEGALVDARAREFDVVHAHDFTALRAGAELADERGVPLVYDTHEYWPGRTRQHRPTPIQRWRESRVEKRLGARAASVITVGDGVAGALVRDYGWPHVTVVRNSFPVPTAPDPVISSPTGALYAGRLAAFRDLETVAQASLSSPIPIEIRGPADDSWLKTFEPGHLTVSPPESVEDVTARLQRLGVSLVTMSTGWENNVLAMPNKLFHAVHAGVPLVVSDVGEIARLTREHDIGRTYQPGDAAGLVQALREVTQDYEGLRHRVIAARSELSWSRDAAALVEVYRSLHDDGDTSTTLGSPGSTDAGGSEDDE